MKGWFSCLSEAKVLRGDGEREEFSSLSYDSRRAKAGDLFLCMKGSTMDSHDKIPELLEKGVRVFVVEKNLPDLPKEMQDREDLCIVQVENGRKALAELSAFYFSYPGKNHNSQYGAGNSYGSGLQLRSHRNHRNRLRGYPRRKQKYHPGILYFAGNIPKNEGKGL